ncbi:hypothetical protein TcasGA2_TC002702 [Tribolium castaneum]|uniref:Uncharacterized protein n=1 Tax=Tribolium castaneum TaxID=7070 RepID=D6WDW0_TRICA|nr:hypothetical protein TcasGA2_TC002702 [Tribolium castaneum]
MPKAEQVFTMSYNTAERKSSEAEKAASPGFTPGLKTRINGVRKHTRIQRVRGAQFRAAAVGGVFGVLNWQAAANSLGYLGKMGIEFSGRDQKRDVITSSTHGRARSGERSPESHRPESLVQQRWAPAGTCTVPRKRRRIILNGRREIMRGKIGALEKRASFKRGRFEKAGIKRGFHIFGLGENATMERIRKNYKETCKCEKRFSLYEVLTEFIGGFLIRIRLNFAKLATKKKAGEAQGACARAV